MTPKQKVLKKYPNAELAKDGCRDVGDDGLEFYDFAIFNGKRFIAQGPTPQTAWDEARRTIERRAK